MHESQFKKRTLKCHKFASHEIYFTKSESILLFVTNITALNKMILYTFTSYLPHSQSQAVPALPGQNSMPIGWGNLGHLFYWLKIPQICCCYIWGCLEPRWGRKVPQLIPQNFKHSDSVFTQSGRDRGISLNGRNAMMVRFPWEPSRTQGKTTIDGQVGELFQMMSNKSYNSCGQDLYSTLVC